MKIYNLKKNTLFGKELLAEIPKLTEVFTLTYFLNSKYNNQKIRSLGIFLSWGEAYDYMVKFFSNTYNEFTSCQTIINEMDDYDIINGESIFSITNVGRLKNVNCLYNYNYTVKISKETLFFLSDLNNTYINRIYSYENVICNKKMEDKYLISTVV